MTNTGKTVLIVEGDNECASFCSDVLKKDGFTVNHVTTAEAARQAVEAGKIPDVVVTEMLLERDDAGIVLCHWLKRNAKTTQVPILMLTDVARKRGITFDLKSPGSREWILANDYAAKPIRAEQLLAHVHHLLGQPAVAAVAHH
ncbi:MAG TPA: response regulator [Candidatus Ozemobacteraceae bacterium]|jgi:DNA-binding response OmpR family regulator